MEKQQIEEEEESPRSSEIKSVKSDDNNNKSFAVPSSNTSSSSSGKSTKTGGISLNWRPFSASSTSSSSLDNSPPSELDPHIRKKV